MKIMKSLGYIITFVFIVSIIYLTVSVRDFEMVSAADIDYKDFYEFNELPNSNIVLTDTFQLITAEREIGGVRNYGPSIDPDRSDVVIITQDLQWQFGGLWYKNEIDMKKDFSMLMYVNLGNKWDNGNYDGTRGADGITFTIQGHTNTSGVALNRTIGANGAGLGAYSKDSDDNDPFNPYRSNYIRNALVLEFDTFYNNHELSTHDNGTPNFGNGGENGDKFYGHLDLTKTPNWTGADSGPFYKTHDISSPYFRSPENLSNAFNQDLTDRRWRKVEVIWDSVNYKLTYNIAGYNPIVYTFTDMEEVTNTFGGDLVYWGFTGSTGDSYNLQKVGIFNLPDQTEMTIDKLGRNITKDGEAAEFSESTIMKLGDVIEYQVEVDYPDDNNTQELVEAFIEDKLADELEYVAGSLRVQKNGENVSPNPVWNDGNVQLGNVEPGSTFIVTYQAKVLEEGIIDNIAIFGSKYTNPISDTAQIYSGSLVVKKVDENNDPLIDAEFTITGPDNFSLNLPRIGEESAAEFIVEYLEPGEYTVTETSAPSGYLLSAIPQSVTVVKGDEASPVTFVNYPGPGIIKEQKNSDANESEYGESSETLVGDNVDFKITSSLPADIFEYQDFSIFDELDTRLTLVENSVQLTTDSEVNLIIGADYDVSVSGNSLEASLTESGLAKLQDVSELILSFTALVNESTLVDLTDIPNTATLDFTNKSGASGKPTTNETITIPLTGEVHILKVYKDELGEEAHLPGAVFSLERRAGSTWESFGDEKISSENGLLGWTKLPKGEYRIVEIEAPEGYLLLANPIEFEITSDSTTHEQNFKVENKPREELPQTGGPGTIMFTVIGSLLMLIAGISTFVLMRNKKDTNYNGNGE